MGHIMRGAVTVISGQAKAGKSMLMLTQAMSLATGLPWGQFVPPDSVPLKVLMINAEDDQDEQFRRAAAAQRQFDVKPDAYCERLRGIQVDGPITLMEYDEVTKRIIRLPLWDALMAELDAFKPDVLMLDPLVELHDADENKNGPMKAVMSELRGLARERHIGIVVAHHIRKGAVTPGDLDAARGAGAIVGAARVLMTFGGMSEDDAKALGIRGDERLRYARLDMAGSNYAPRAGARWFEVEVHELENGERIAALKPWSPPGVFDDLDMATCVSCIEEIDGGIKGPDGTVEFYTDRKDGDKRWAGHVVMRQTGKPAEGAANVVKQWIASGVLERGVYHSPSSRKERQCVRALPSMLDDMRRQAHVIGAPFDTD